jgi:WD40 repeat protein
LLAVVPAATGHWHALAFTAGGQLLASGGSHGCMTVWDVSAPAHPVPAVQLTHTGFGLPGAVRRSVGSPAHPSVTAVAFSPGGRLLASGASDGSVIVWDISTLTCPVPAARPATPPAPAGGRRRNLGQAVKAVAFSPGGQLLACASGQYAAVWDVTSPAHPAERTLLAHRARQGGKVTAVAFSPRGHLLATAASGRKAAVSLWDITGGHLIQVTSIHAEIVAWELERTHAPRTVNAVAFGRGGQLLATASGHTSYESGLPCSSGTVLVWDITDPTHAVRSPALPRRQGSEATTVSFSADGHLLASNRAATVVVWDITDPAHPAIATTLTGHHSATTAVTFSPHTPLLASCGTDLRLWDMS